MFSTTLSPLPDMVAHASSADAPFDSEVSTADLDSEAFATTPSAPTPSSPSSSAEAIQLDLLSQLMDTDLTTTTASNTDNNSATSTSTSTSTSTLLSDHSIIAMASTSSSSAWAHSPSISPMVLKLESPVLATLAAPASKSKATSSASSTAASSSRKRPSTAEPMDKEAKARERVLRNRAAAQESRDKKRKYVSEIEASNESLQQENCHLLKRLKTVESDNLALSQRLETLTAQFAQMQQLLTQSLKQNQPGAGFCQSAVLAKKDEMSCPPTGTLTNSPQQKLAPQGNPHTTTLMQAPPARSTKHRPVYSMTMKTSMSKLTSPNREARLLDPSAAQTRMETSCRPSCNNNRCRNRALTLSSSAAASFQQARTFQLQAATFQLSMMLFLSTILPQLMLNFSTLFLTSTGARSSNPRQRPQPLLRPQEQRLQQAVLSFIRQLSSSRRSNAETVHLQRHRRPNRFDPRTPRLRSKTIQDNISSLDKTVMDKIVTEARLGHMEVARALLVKALLTSRFNLGNNSIKGLLFTLRKK
ncbi:hypothetical protein KVV02_005146 [Mortierella alpina]|uniref:BZIP domain-containing protein n=1 Tax=Mortierella alpina TaxID=64518 RepID=A0A9P8CUU5_MORAP|nr:hypothetical protein KVV02_005146 [Mortierella alpina]